MGRDMSFNVKQRETERPRNRLVDMSVGGAAAVFAWVITAGIAWLVWRSMK